MASDWTVDTLKEYLEKLIEARSSAASQAVATALVAQEKAILKAELAAEKRFDSVNEFRQTLSDQQATFATKSETALQYKGLVEKVDRLENQSDARIAKGVGVRDGWGLAVGVVGFVVGLIGAGIALFR